MFSMTKSREFDEVQALEETNAIMVFVVRYCNVFVFC